MDTTTYYKKIEDVIKEIDKTNPEFAEDTKKGFKDIPIIKKIANNQYMIITNNGTYFQSYDSTIAYVPKGINPKIYLDFNKWDCSKTTLKYLYVFLNRVKPYLKINGKKEIENKIKEGTIILTDLNW